MKLSFLLENDPLTCSDCAPFVKKTLLRGFREEKNSSSFFRIFAGWQKRTIGKRNGFEGFRTHPSEFVRPSYRDETGRARTAASTRPRPVSASTAPSNGERRAARGSRPRIETVRARSAPERGRRLAGNGTWIAFTSRGFSPTEFERSFRFYIRGTGHVWFFGSGTAMVESDSSPRGSGGRFKHVHVHSDRASKALRRTTGKNTHSKKCWFLETNFENRVRMHATLRRTMQTHRNRRRTFIGAAEGSRTPYN